MQDKSIAAAPDVEIEIVLDGTEHEETLLFLPGLGAHAMQFLGQVKHFAHSYRTLTLSLRGHGHSTSPPAPSASDLTLEKLAADVQTVLKQLDIASAHVVGNSTGGLVGYELMPNAPGTVRSLTTFGTTAELHMGAMGTIVVWLDRVLGPTGAAWLAKRTVSKHSATAELVADMIQSTPKSVLVNLRRNLIDYNYLPVLQSHPEVPVLVVQGEHDDEINRMLDTTLASLRARGNCRVVQLSEAGHFANLDQPAAFNQALTEFLRDIPKEEQNVFTSEDAA
jgi:pimeloyl-ACP methyl ester carboxylesterase